MKTIKYLMIAIAALVMTACSKSGEELLKVIPEHPSMVVRVNLESLCTNHNLCNEDGKFVVPQDLGAVLDAHRSSYFARIAKSLPASGIDFASHAYIFSASPEFEVEMIALLSDEGSAEKWVCNMCNENSMQSDKGIEYLFHDGVLYAIDNGILFIGAATSSSNIAKLTETVSGMMKCEGKTLADNGTILKALEGDADATAYLAVQPLCKHSATKHLKVAGISVANVLSGMEIDALAMSINLDKTLDMTARVIAKPTSAYKMMFGSLVSKPSADFLKIMPASLSTLLSVSVRGNVLLQMQPVANLIGTARAFPIIRDFDFKKIITTIDGPVAIGVSLDPDFIDEYNVVVAMASTDTGAVIEQLNSVAAKYGKHPQKVGNESVYEYFNQRITVGVLDNRFVYFKVNTDDIDNTPVADEDVHRLFAESPIGASLTAEGYHVALAFESSEKIACSVQPLGDDATMFVTLIEALCGIDTTRHIDEDYDSDFGVAAPIDEMTSF